MLNLNRKAIREMHARQELIMEMLDVGRSPRYLLALIV